MNVSSSTCRLRRLYWVGVSTIALQGCAVVAVVDTVGTVAVKSVGLAADAVIGAAKITGRAVGATADAVIPDSAEP